MSPSRAARCSSLEANLNIVLGIDSVAFANNSIRGSASQEPSVDSSARKYGTPYFVLETIYDECVLLGEVTGLRTDS